MHRKRAGRIHNKVSIAVVRGMELDRRWQWGSTLYASVQITELNTKLRTRSRGLQPNSQESFSPRVRCQGQFAQMWYIFCFSQSLARHPTGSIKEVWVTQGTPLPFHSHKAVPPIAHFIPSVLSRSSVLPQSPLISPPQNSYAYVFIHQLRINYEWFCDFRW